MSVRVVTMGASGYAVNYVQPLLDNMCNGTYTYAGVIDIAIEKSPLYEKIKENKIPIYKTLREYFENGNKADLVIIAIPPQFHAENSLIAIENGADVLCEKPTTPLYKDALEMIEASQKSGKFIGISYQWSYSDANRAFKEDILSGKLGKAIELKSFISWPRELSYYDGTWKGNIKDADGTFILDSVVSNATAHYLHNMYFLLGDRMNTCCYPRKIRCELLRANNIENFDTCLLDINTDNNKKITFVASHATDRDEDPKFIFKFENATVTFNMKEQNNHIIAEFVDGTIKDYGNPFDNLNNRIWDSIDSVVSRKPLVCTVETTIAHTLTINKLYECAGIVDFPPNMVGMNKENNRVVVGGLYELLFKAYDRGCLLSDMGIEWTEVYEIDVTK